MSGLADNLEADRDDPIADVRAAMAQLDAPAEPGDTEALDTEPEGRKRSSDGKFSKQEAAAEKTAPDEIQATTDSQKATGNGTQPAITAPTSWSPEAKAEWAKLSPALQQAVIKREKEVSDGFAQKSNELQTWKQVEGVLAPRRSQFQQLGFKTDVEAINHLLAFSDSYARDPAGTIAFLAKQAGLQSPQGMVQPQQSIQQPDIARVVQDQLGMVFAQREIEDFKSETAKYPHFEKLRPVMSELLMSGRAENLEAAYKKAMRLDDDLYQQETDRLIRERTAKTSTSATERFVKAKQATKASLTGAPHGTPAKGPAKSYANPHDDAVADVRAAMEQIGAG